MNRRFKLIIASVLVVAVLHGTLADAIAGGPGSYNPDPNAPTSTGEISVVSGASGVTIFISMSDTSPGRPVTPPSTQIVNGPSGPVCSSTPMNIGNATAGWVRDGLQANPDTIPWAVNCDNGYFGIAWVPVAAPGPPRVVVTGAGAPPVDPAALAASILGTVPLPPIRVGASPGVGLVALPSWFWVDGYDGSTLRGSRTLGLVTVEVEITPQGYRWVFGDGRELHTTSLGRPYPEQSDIRHAYEQSSLAAGGSYELRLEITFSARYRVNGGGWIPLAPVTQTYARDYPVRQLQSVLTRN